MLKEGAAKVRLRYGWVLVLFKKQINRHSWGFLPLKLLK